MTEAYFMPIFDLLIVLAALGVGLTGLSVS